MSPRQVNAHTQPKPEAAAVSPTCGQHTARSFNKTGTTTSIVILIMSVMLRAIGNDLQGIAQCCTFAAGRRHCGGAALGVS